MRPAWLCQTFHRIVTTADAPLPRLRCSLPCCAPILINSYSRPHCHPADIALPETHKWPVRTYATSNLLRIEKIVVDLVSHHGFRTVRMTFFILDVRQELRASPCSDQVHTISSIKPRRKKACRVKPCITLRHLTAQRFTIHRSWWRTRAHPSTAAAWNQSAIFHPENLSLGVQLYQRRAAANPTKPAPITTNLL